ncbi:hypothetical protein EG833_04400 [archaeon]|nr:hypothetical protein [archaeon]
MRPYRRTTNFSYQDGTIMGYSISLQYSTDAIPLSVVSYSYSDPGPDGHWYSADDALSCYDRIMGKDGNTTRLVLYMGPGNDGIWMNDDDYAGVCGSWILDPAGSLTEDFYYTGPDGTAWTADDLLYYHIRNTSDGNSALSLSSGGTGDDGEWFTGDDPNFYYEKFTYDEGRLVKRTWYSNGEGSSTPGNDGIWLTGDDVPYRYSTCIYDGTCRMTREYTYGAGPDNECNTGDDVVESFTVYYYATDGALSEERTSSPGLDGLCGTGDDWLFQKVEYLKEIDIPNG